MTALTPEALADLADRLEKLLERAAPRPWSLEFVEVREGSDAYSLCFVRDAHEAAVLVDEVADGDDDLSPDGLVVMETINALPAIIAALCSLATPSTLRTPSREEIAQTLYEAASRRAEDEGLKAFTPWSATINDSVARYNWFYYADALLSLLPPGRDDGEKDKGAYVAKPDEGGQGEDNDNARYLKWIRAGNDTPPRCGPADAVPSGDVAPGHTDLMVSPESIDAYLDQPSVGDDLERLALKARVEELEGALLAVAEVFRREADPHASGRTVSAAKVWERRLNAINAVLTPTEGESRG